MNWVKVSTGYVNVENIDYIITTKEGLVFAFNGDRVVFGSDDARVILDAILNPLGNCNR